MKIYLLGEGMPENVKMDKLIGCFGQRSINRIQEHGACLILIYDGISYLLFRSDLELSYFLVLCQVVYRFNWVWELTSGS